MDDSIGLDLDKIKLGYNGSILYIDDEKEKGWNELFCTLLYDGIVNKVKKFESIGEEFHGMETNEIVVSTVNKAKSFDLVILDFRLTQTDFNETDPRKITGFKILEGIKKHNKGIQVIVFSATNKVWNIQALQAAGADGFILKESLENSVEANFTKNSLENMMITINTGLSLSFLKTLHAYIQEVKDYFDANSQEFNSLTRKFECIYSRFQNEVYNQLLIAFECLSNSRKNQKKNEFNQKYVDLALISIYKIMELFNSKYINDHSLIVNGFNGRLLNGDHPSTLDKFAYVVQVNFEMELITIIGFLEMYNDMRNDIIHPKRKGRQRKSLPQDLINFVQIMKTFILKSD
jgi:CheY-like chemotaxis protein